MIGLPDLLGLAAHHAGDRVPQILGLMLPGPSSSVQFGHLARLRGERPAQAPGPSKVVQDFMICPSCGEPVRGRNARIAMRDDGFTVPDVVRGEKGSKGPTMPLVFDGCTMCLERRFVDDPVGTFLLKDWLRARPR